MCPARALVRRAEAVLVRLDDATKRQARRALLRLVRVGRNEEGGGTFPASLAEKALGQMVGDGGFSADVCGQGEVVRKREAGEAAPEAAWGGPGRR